MKRALLILPLLLPMAACQGDRIPGQPETSHEAETADTKPTIVFDPTNVKILTPVPGQRFTPTTSPLVSYGGQTGSLCMTYDWEKSTSRRSSMRQGYGMMICPDLMDRYPMAGDATFKEAIKQCQAQR